MPEHTDTDYSCSPSAEHKIHIVMTALAELLNASSCFSLNAMQSWVTQECVAWWAYVFVHDFKCDKSQLGPGLIKNMAAVIREGFLCYSSFSLAETCSM